MTHESLGHHWFALSLLALSAMLSCAMAKSGKKQMVECLGVETTVQSYELPCHFLEKGKTTLSEVKPFSN